MYIASKILLSVFVGAPCSLKDGSCLTDRKATNSEEYGTTLILSVDDEPINHMVIEECISGTGYKVCARPLIKSLQVQAQASVSANQMQVSDQTLEPGLAHPSQVPRSWSALLWRVLLHSSACISAKAGVVAACFVLSLSSQASPYSQIPCTHI